MTDSDGDAASRLSARLEEILQGRGAEPADEPADEPAAAPSSPESPYELPEIVSATVEQPALPPRQQVRPAVGVPAASAVPRPPQAAAPGPMMTPQVAVAAPAAAPAQLPVAPARPVTAWGDHVPSPSTRPGTQLRAPGRRPRVRRVTRVVRHVDPWSVFKVALVFSFVGYLVVLTSGVLLWRVAESTGTLDNVERWFTQFGWETFEFKGGEIFGNAWVIGLFMAVGLTGAAVLMATLFNLVSDIVGGIRVTVLEEEVVERTAASTRRYVVRRPPMADAAIAGATQWSVDDDGPLPASGPATRPPTPSAATPAPVVQPAADWSVDDDPTG